MLTRNRSRLGDCFDSPVVLRMLVTVLPSWTTPGRFDDPEDGWPREITSSSSPNRSPPIRVTRRAMGSQWMDHRLEARGGVARGNFTSGVEWRISSFEAASLASAKRPSVKRAANVRQLTVCWPKTAEFMPATFLQLTMAHGENIMFKLIKQLVRMQRSPKLRTQPLPEEDLGGGDVCSLQEQPSTDDDQPLD
jgi:hypothetical protein